MAILKIPINKEIVDFVEEKFSGKTDKAGKPYVEHLYRVAEMAAENTSFRRSYEHYIVGLLHDVLEDTDATPEDLFLLGISSRNIDRVKILTRNKEDSYKTYIDRIIRYSKKANDTVPLKVKIADLTDNLNLGRLKCIGKYDLARADKYGAARMRLQDVFANLKK